ncbi:MAG TPA: segregation/condensation protein A [Armatimonadota bacterium]|nr:segregation/condensation protein A [Armatimonadota bacterium]
MPYAIRIPVFEGPLDLLLHLIRTHKLDIRDIPVALVTEQYLEYLALMESLDLDIAGEFLVMAATLMEIKSRMLLPRPEPLPDEDEGRDPRAELVERLLEYERFQQVAEQLRDLAAESGRTFPRPVVEQWEGAVPLVELRPGDLLEALRRMVRDEEAAEDGAARAPSLRVRRHAVNLKQRIAEVLRRVYAHNGEALPFSSLVIRSGRRVARQEVLVTFLAVLELVRQGQITAWQRGALGEILLLPKAPPAVAEAGAA